MFTRDVFVVFMILSSEFSNAIVVDQLHMNAYISFSSSARVAVKLCQ